MSYREHHESRHQEDFVGQGVKVGSQPALLVEQAGNESISAVTHSGNDKHNQRSGKIFADKIDYENGGKYDPQAGYQIR